MTDREELRERLDAVEDAIADPSGDNTPDLDDAHIEAIRDLLMYRYQRGEEPISNPWDDPARREVLADAAERVDLPHATRLPEEGST